MWKVIRADVNSKLPHRKVSVWWAFARFKRCLPNPSEGGPPPSWQSLPRVPVGNAHNVLRRLEDEGFVAAQGLAAPFVVESRIPVSFSTGSPWSLLPWRIRERLHIFIYASDPDK